MSPPSGFINSSRPPDPATLFDKNLFNKQICCLAVECPRNKSQVFATYFKSNVPWLIKPPGNPPITVIVLLPSLKEETLTKDDREFTMSHEGKFIKYVVNLTFDNWKTEYILKKLLPNERDVTCHFESVGHIAHLNLRECLNYVKYTIGAVILEKNREYGIKTVVNKVGIVENEFRTLPMELIAGESNTLVTVLETNCSFHFDYSQVFWNSRLQGEHNRIVRLCSKSDVVCDVFAGIGPFSIPLAKKGCITYANDLNPHSYKWMLHNAKENLGKKKCGLLTCYNMDGQEFVRTLICDQSIRPTQIIMNLPKLAPEFCKIFVGLFPHDYSPLPTIHVYCFASNSSIDAMEKDCINRIQNSIKTHFVPNHIQKIRQTSKNTFEFCVSFQIPQCIAYKNSQL